MGSDPICYAGNCNYNNYRLIENAISRAIFGVF